MFSYQYFQNAIHWSLRTVHFILFNQNVDLLFVSTNGEYCKVSKNMKVELYLLFG